MRLVIFDLSGVLISKTRLPKQRIPRDLPYHLRDYDYYQVWFRPGITECFEQLRKWHFEVAIWTSNPRRRAVEMIHQLCCYAEFDVQDFYFTLDRSSCLVYTDHSSAKPKSLLLERNLINSQDQILFVDDTLEKHECNPISDVMIIPEFRIEREKKMAQIDYQLQYDFVSKELPLIIKNRFN